MGFQALQYRSQSKNFGHQACQSGEPIPMNVQLIPLLVDFERDGLDTQQVLARALGWRAECDPSRHFATVNCRIGDGEHGRRHLNARRSRHQPCS
jgi:hypothetical protein